MKKIHLRDLFQENRKNLFVILENRDDVKSSSIFRIILRRAAIFDILYFVNL